MGYSDTTVRGVGNPAGTGFDASWSFVGNTVLPPAGAKQAEGNASEFITICLILSCL